jgi:hypothetical protein
MKLADWMHENRVTPGDLTGLLGLKSRMTVKRYLEGDRVPSGRILQQLTGLTGGRVRRKDFLDTSPPKCAAMIPTPGGGTRLVFPWSGDDAAAEAAMRGMLAGPREHSLPKYRLPLPHARLTIYEHRPSPTPNPASPSAARVPLANPTHYLHRTPQGIVSGR